MMSVDKLQTQENSQANLYSNLVQVLEELTALYGNLLTLLQSEKSFLISAEVEKLTENNRTKEALLFKIRNLDRKRQSSASELAKNLGLPPEELRLLELAKKMKSKMRETEAQQLQTIHRTLTMQIERAMDYNRENEEYANSALRTLNGAIKDIQRIVSVKPTYGKKGQMAGSQEANAGSFVSREA